MEATILQPPMLDIDIRIGKPVIPRGRIERRVVWNLLAHLERAGWYPEAVQSDDEVPTPDAKAVMEEVFNLDDAWVYFRKSADGHSHSVRLVFGNDGWDCISDWRYSRDDADGFNAAMEAFDPEQYV